MKSASYFHERRSLRRRLTMAFALTRLRVSYWAWRGIGDAFRLGFRPKDTTNSEWWTAFFMMLLGAWLIAPGDAFSPAFKVMRQALPEWLWGAIFLAAGRFAMHAMVQARYCLRSTAQMILCGCGLFLLVLSIESQTGSILVMVAAIYAWRCFLIARQLSAGEKC